MRSTFKVLFYLKKNAPKANGKVPVMGRITVNGSIAQFSCKFNVAPQLWDLKSNRAVGKSLESQKINREIDNIRVNVFLMRLKKSRTPLLCIHRRLEYFCPEK